MQHKFYAAGDKIRIRVSESRIDDRVVWESKEKCVLVCSQRQYDWLRKGDFRATPIGVKWTDVESGS
jgi:hypothetical protein